jgi:hypothetical protein
MDDFWDTATDAVCVMPQGQVAVYKNTTGYVTIRQKSDSPYDPDSAIFILPEYVNEVVNALLRLKKESEDEVV